ncbi:UNVERIFIED_CONTAM: hypothetical protein NY603_32870, partial [Bacteroidetes bacterium 56_B9]
VQERQTKEDWFRERESDVSAMAIKCCHAYRSLAVHKRCYTSLDLAFNGSTVSAVLAVHGFKI